MKSGKYVASFNVDLVNCETLEEAIESIQVSLTELMDRGACPDFELVFVKDTELDYTLEEDELEELNFDRVV